MLDFPISNSASEDSTKTPVGAMARLRRAAWAFTTRRVRGRVCGLAEMRWAPKAGDLVLARVDSIGYHSALQLPDGRRKHLFVRDEIVVAYGNRYAPNQFEAVVPKTLGPCQLVAAGGVAAKALSWHSNVTKGATQITPIGLLAGQTGDPANLRDYALPSIERLPSRRPPIVAVVGTAMDSGKTQTAGHLVKGLSHAGLRVGYAKVTGTGAGGDMWFLRDAGSNLVLDFTDAGAVSTYLLSAAEMERIFVTLVAHLTKARLDCIVLEIADGVLQRETSALLASDVFREAVGGVIFASCDAMGAVAGAAWLKSRNLPLVALSGVLTASPLQREEASKATGLPIFSRQDLAQEKAAQGILGLVERERPRRGVASRSRATRGSDEFGLQMSVVTEPSAEGLGLRAEATK